MTPFSQAAVVAIPPGLNAGDQYRLVFVTQFVVYGNSTDITTYNNAVTSAASVSAELVALGTTWTSIASTPSVHARDNTGTNPSLVTGVPIYNLAGLLVANNNADLWDGSTLASSSIANPININPTGAANTLNTGVWTGTSGNGMGWSGFQLGQSQTSQGTYNSPTNWVQNFNTSNTDPAQNQIRFLYGISGILTAPEPTRLLLLMLGLGIVIVRRKRLKRNASTVRCVYPFVPDFENPPSASA